MKENEREPNIKKFFKEENLCVQYAYKAKEKYNVIYINSKLYEELFDEKYEWETAKEKISDMFSITLNEEKSNKQIAGKAYSDKQLDPTNLALSGNLGSGRAYFFDKYFNIKGDKTKLATSPKSIYSNGKLALSPAIKETIFANILSEDFVIPTFETLAILETKERFDFQDEFLDENDNIRTVTYNLPCAIEIRVNKDKELYRISNRLINKQNFTIEELETLYENFAKIEANKFCDRFIHGSWSVGNVSTDGNLIDFDTASFVKGRFPQYSNTNKYKSNYFGYELLGQKMMCKAIIESQNIENSEEVQAKLEKLMDQKYIENIKIRFCDLIGLDYKTYYERYNKYIDDLCKKFTELSRKFLPNYNETSIYTENGDITYLFDFSKFFQKYLICNFENKKSILFNLKLLLNEAEYIEYDKVGFIKEKINQYFENDLVNEQNMDNYIEQAISFIKEYDELFDKISKETELSEIMFKQYVINANRNSLYGYENIYGKLSDLYDTKKLDDKSLNRIITALIKTNKRNNYTNNEEVALGLHVEQDFLTYFVLSKKYYYFIIEPYTKTEIEFAKAIINGEEVMMKHSSDQNGEMLISEKIEFSQMLDILDFSIKIKINGEYYKNNIL